MLMAARFPSFSAVVEGEVTAVRFLYEKEVVGGTQHVTRHFPHDDTITVMTMMRHRTGRPHGVEREWER